MRYFFSRRAGETLAYAIEIVQRRRRDPKTSVMHGLDTAFPFSPGLSLSCIDQVIGDIALCGFLPVFSREPWGCRSRRFWLAQSFTLTAQGNPMHQEPRDFVPAATSPALALGKTTQMV